jgi:hypothetical protein
MKTNKILKNIKLYSLIGLRMPQTFVKLYPIKTQSKKIIINKSKMTAIKTVQQTNT